MRQRIKEIRSWKTPATLYESGESGMHRLDHYIQNVGLHNSYAMGPSYYILRPIMMTSLTEYRDGKWHYWMTDNPVEYWSMLSYAEQAHGKVLVGGLGLALLPNALDSCDVTIVEINPDVINLVGRYVPDNMKIINADLWDFIEGDNTSWDYIIIDIWATETKEEHGQLFSSEVEGKAEYLRTKYPDSSITIHGFPQVSDLKVNYEKAH